MDASADPRTSFLSRFARDINCLSDPDRFKRKRALETLSKELFEGANAPTPIVRRTILLEDLHRQLLALLADPVEMNREASITFVSRAVESDVEGRPELLSALLPAFSARVGRTPFPEEAEELRMQLAQLLNTLLATRECSRAVRQSFPEIADILKALSADNFHSVKVEAATAMVHAANAAPDKVHMSLGALVTACVANLGHQRGPVRLSSLSAMHELLPLGGESLPSTLANVALPAFQALRYDRTPSVRRQLAATLAHLHHSLPGDVVGPVEAHLLVLECALIADDTPEVAETALTAFEAAAKKRRAALEAPKEQAAKPEDLTGDLAVAAAAAAPDSSVHGYDAAVGAAEDMARGYTGRGGETMTAEPIAAGTGAATAPAHKLPHPFTRRPHPDSIWVCQRVLPSLMSLVLEQVKDWTPKTRLSGAGALRSILVLAEGAIVNHLDALIASLCTGSRDEDPDVRKTLGEVGRLLGAFAPAPAQLGVLLPQLRGEISGLNNGQHYASALAVLSAAVSSMTRATLAPHLSAVAATLSLPSLCDEEPAPLKQQLAAALAFTVRVGVAGEIFASGTGAPASAAVAPPGGSAASSSSEWHASGPTPSLTSSRDALLPEDALDNLLRALLHVRDVNAIPEVAASGLETSRVLARACRYTTVADMYAARSASLLAPLLSTSSTWSKGSHERRVFDTFLRYVRPAVSGTSMEQARDNVQAIVGAFCSSLAPSRDPELRVCQLALLDSFITPTPQQGAAATAATATDPLRGKPLTHMAAAAEVGAKKGSALAAAHAVSVAADTEAGKAADATSSFFTAGGAAHSVSDTLVDEILADNVGTLLQQALLPNAVWRVGLVAATIRKVCMACIASLGRRRLLPLHALQPVFGEALPVLKSCLADDDATTRHLTCTGLSHMLAVLHHSLDGETVHALYPELLKRLDDSNDAVRLSGCAAIRDLAIAANKQDLAGTAAEYTLDMLLVHLDDADGAVQAAVYEASLPYVKMQPAYAKKTIAAARTKHRHPGYCDKLLAYLATVEGSDGAAAPGGGGPAAAGAT